MNARPLSAARLPLACAGRSIAKAIAVALALPCAGALATGCSSSPATTTDGGSDGGGVHTDPAALQQTLMDLAAFGQKRVGTDPGKQAAAYVAGRMTAAGLADVHMETFTFPRFDIASSSLTLTDGGAPVTPAPKIEVFEASGSGHAAGPVVWVQSASDADLMGVDLTGKIALVQRNSLFHRSTQARNVAAKGALAMLYISQAPKNLIQIGSVRRQFEAQIGIPAVTVGATDGMMLQQRAMAGTLTATLDVQAGSTPATGQNVVGRIVGTDPTHQILIGAHYDSWFTGSSDNGGGVAAVLALAARRAKAAQPRYTLTFVAYDGEEVALYGGYHHLRQHQIVKQEGILAVLNFEIPAATPSKLFGLAHSNTPALDMALRDASLGDIYTYYLGMETVPQLFGGIIPTDIQGDYRSGLPTASTACDSAYYHTTEDTPDKVDTMMLAGAVDGFDAAIGELLTDDPASFNGRDPKLWQAQVTPRPRQAGQPLVVDVAIADGAGQPKANAPVDGTLLVDHFFQKARLSAMTDAGGKATLMFDAADVDAGMGNRFLHVTAGPMWPLVEQIVALP